MKKVYKKLINRMVERLDSEDILKYVYIIVKDVFKEDKGVHHER